MYRRCSTGADCSEWITGNRIHWYYERQGGTLHARSPPQRATRAERACKFNRNIFVAMVEQSRDSVVPLNVMNGLSWIHCRSICHGALTLFAIKGYRIQFRRSTYFFPPFISHALSAYIVRNITRSGTVDRCICRCIMMPRKFRIFAPTFRHHSSCLGCLYALLSDASTHGTNMFLVLLFASQRDGRWYTFSVTPSSDTVRFVYLCLCGYALYIYTRKPSVCWIFTTDCPVKRLCSSNILERGCSGVHACSQMWGKIVLYDVVYGALSLAK